MFLSVSSLNILFSIKVHVVAYLGLLYPLCSYRWQWKCLFIIAVLFPPCVCVELFLHITIYTCVLFMARMQQLPTLFYLILDVWSGGRTSIEALFLFDLKGDGAAGSCQLHAWMLVCYRTFKRTLWNFRLDHSIQQIMIIISLLFPIRPHLHRKLPCCCCFFFLSFWAHMCY